MAVGTGSAFGGPAPGHPAGFVTAQQQGKLKTLVEQGPAPERDGVAHWRCVDLQREIARRFAVEMHESTVGKWLHQLGLSRLQPRPFHPKTDATKQQALEKTSVRC